LACGRSPSARIDNESQFRLTESRKSLRATQEYLQYRTLRGVMASRRVSLLPRSNVSALLAQGGPVMYVLLGLSVFSLAIVLMKAVQLMRLRLVRIAALDEALAACRRNDFATAHAAVSGCPHPVAVALRVSIETARDSGLGPEAAQAEVERVGTGAVRDLESWLRGLSGIAHLSPLLGLLGTVLGMIKAFMEIQKAGSSVDPAVLSGGIWEALLTTAFGLTIAIPSMAAFYVFEGEVDRIRSRMVDVSTWILVRVGKLPSDRRPAVGEASARQDFAV
jgi:biopolymer transport protein ExbB